MDSELTLIDVIGIWYIVLILLQRSVGLDCLDKKLHPHCGILLMQKGISSVMVPQQNKAKAKQTEMKQTNKQAKTNSSKQKERRQLTVRKNIQSIY